MLIIFDKANEARNIGGIVTGSVSIAIQNAEKKLLGWLPYLQEIKDSNEEEIKFAAGVLRQEKYAKEWLEKYAVKYGIATAGNIKEVNLLLLRREMVECLELRSRSMALKMLTFIPEEQSETFMKWLDPLEFHLQNILKDGAMAYAFLLFLSSTQVPALLNPNIVQALGYRILSNEIGRLGMMYFASIGKQLDSTNMLESVRAIYEELKWYAIYSPSSYPEESHEQLLEGITKLQNNLKNS